MAQQEIRRPRPHPGQKVVLASKARYKVLLCGRRWGKSVVAVVAAIDKMCGGNKKAVAYITPEYSLAKVFFNELLDRFPKGVIKASNISDLYIELKNGSSIKFFSGEAINNIRGREFDLAIVDEAALIPDLKTVWFSVVKPTLAIRRGEALFISTPRGMNFFYSLYLKGKNREDGFESWHFPSNTNPYFPAEEFEEAKASTPEDQFNEEYLALPMANQANPFGPHIDKNIVKELSTKPVLIYGIDLAATTDWTVVVGLDENANLAYFDRFRISYPETKKRLLQLPKGVKKIVDKGNGGQATVPDLILEDPSFQGFEFTGKSKPIIIMKLVEAVEKGEITYNDVIANEMKAFERTISTAGNLKFGAQSGYHDDCVAALAMANYHLKQLLGGMYWSLSFK
jgi:hypothetical protein